MLSVMLLITNVFVTLVWLTMTQTKVMLQ